MARKQSLDKSRETALRCAQIADEYRGRDTIVLDLTGLTPIVDFFVITTGTSRRQMHAITEEVHRVLKADGQKRIGVEGAESETWILLDYGDVVLHVFSEDSRQRYDLEHLWADAERTAWDGNDESRNSNDEGMSNSE